MQAREAAGGEAFAPDANSVAFAVQFGGDLLVVGAIVVRGTQNELAAQAQGLRGGACADQCLKLMTEFGGQ